MRWGCQTLLDTCQQLKIEDPLIPTWKTTLENLTPFQHPRTQGAFLVTAVRKKGKTKFIQIESLASEPCRVWTDMPGPVADSAITIKSLGDGVVEIPLKKGQSVILHPKGETPDLAIAPVTADPANTNVYGVHSAK